jgi:hypothetical protein
MAVLDGDAPDDSEPTVAALVIDAGSAMVKVCEL